MLIQLFVVVGVFLDLLSNSCVFSLPLREWVEAGQGLCARLNPDVDRCDNLLAS